MIDWDKPIQTIDGRKARVIGSHPGPPGDPTDEGHFVPRMVWIESARGHFFGDVFFVTSSGVRCDDTAMRARPSVPEVREPIIRNAPVKREGWAIKKKDSDRFWDSHIYSSKENAEKNKPDGYVVVRMEWEE